MWPQSELSCGKDSELPLPPPYHFRSHSLSTHSPNVPNGAPDRRVLLGRDLHARLDAVGGRRENRRQHGGAHGRARVEQRVRHGEVRAERQCVACVCVSDQ